MGTGEEGPEGGGVGVGGGGGREGGTWESMVRGKGVKDVGGRNSTRTGWMWESVGSVYAYDSHF